jgi:hypothetical protein
MFLDIYPSLPNPQKSQIGIENLTIGRELLTKEAGAYFCDMPDRLPDTFQAVNYSFLQLNKLLITVQVNAFKT